MTAWVRVLGLTTLLDSAGNVGMILYLKELDYRRAALYGQLPFLVSALAAVSLAFEPTLSAGNAGHHAILNAIERGDSDEAERLARAHAQLTVKNLESVLETGGLEKLPGSSLISDAGWASRTSLQA